MIMGISSVLKQDPILRHVVDPMTGMIDMIVEAEDDMTIVVEAVADTMMIDDRIGVVVDITIGGVVIETKNNRKYQI